MQEAVKNGEQWNTFKTRLKKLNFWIYWLSLGTCSQESIKQWTKFSYVFFQIKIATSREYANSQLGWKRAVERSW